MNKRKLQKIREKINGFRGRGGIKPIEMESIAGVLGRYRTKKGDEPTWVSEPFPELNPLSIPHHGGIDLNRNTAGDILDQLEIDADRWEDKFESEK